MNTMPMAASIRQPPPTSAALAPLGQPTPPPMPPQAPPAPQGAAPSPAAPPSPMTAMGAPDENGIMHLSNGMVAKIQSTGTTMFGIPSPQEPDGIKWFHITPPPKIPKDVQAAQQPQGIPLAMQLPPAH